jgi:membrane associated rhomboid family serine protease
MGLYDRDYTRYGESQPGFQLAAPQSATMQLMAVTVGVFVLQLLFPPTRTSRGVTEYLALTPDWYRHWYDAYRLLTYGFAHDPHGIEHIVFNMIVLGFFGRPVEDRYGRGPFLMFYLAAIVAGGLLWTASESGLGGAGGPMVGASAAVTGVFILFALNYPRQEIRMFFVIPMPAWVAAMLCVGGDMYGAVARSGPIAFTAHLGGALLALGFYHMGGLRADTWSRWSGILKRRSGPRLRVHAPEDDDADDLSQQVDKILAKIQEKGQDSLTRSERRILEQASRKYQQKRR